MTIVAHTPLQRGASTSHKPKIRDASPQAILDRLNVNIDDIENIVRFTQLCADKINGVLQGRTNNQFDGTLTANAASTVFSDPRIGFDSAILAFPTTANAAAEYGTMYQSTTANGSVTFVHRNTAATDKTFKFIIIG